VTTDFGANDWANALAIQTDGRILAAGASTSGGGASDFIIARYKEDGSLDQSFGLGGHVIMDLGGGEVARSLAIQPDGKILVGGYGGHRTQLTDDLMVVRFDGEGHLDQSFGTDGVVLSDVGGNDIGRSVAVQPDGKVLLAGFTEDGVTSDFVLARYLPGGSLDPGFAIGGIVITDFGGWDEGRGLSLERDGRILVAGMTNANEDFALARYDVNGYLDPIFGLGGKVTTDFGLEEAGNASAIQFTGLLVVVGTTARGPTTHDFALARYVLP
jgi:uncharacterized delta-60 repeat protein